MEIRRRRTLPLWRRRPVLSALGVLLLAAVGLAAAQPATAMCAVIDRAPLDLLPDGSLGDAGLSPADRRAAVADGAAARARIAATYGAPRARPIVVHLGRADALWPVPYNSFGSTSFLPGRTCIVLGPDGRGVDVLAHELVHAEIADRAGYWRRLTQIPVWFDEGAAMQVDARTDFDLPPGADRDASAIHAADTAGRFFDVSSEELTRHYAQAKREMAEWLARTGRGHFYARLAELRGGADFAQVWSGRTDPSPDPDSDPDPKSAGSTPRPPPARRS